MFEHGFCPITKMAATCRFVHVDILTYLSPDFFQISNMNYFYQTLAQVWIWVCPMSDNQDGLQNGHQTFNNVWILVLSDEQ